MELKEFISKTIAEVIAGVRTAQQAAIGSGAVVSPVVFSDQKKGDEFYIGTTNGVYTGKEQVVINVHFDVAVTTTDSTKSKAGLGIFIAGFGIGGQQENKSDDTSLNRIRFAIPVGLPEVDRPYE